MTRLYSLSMECRGSLALFQSLLPVSVSSGCSLDITITTCSNCKRKMLWLAAVDRSVAGPTALVPLTKPLSDLSSDLICPISDLIMRRIEATLTTDSSEPESEPDVEQRESEAEVSEVIEPDLRLFLLALRLFFLLPPPPDVSLPPPLFFFPSLFSLSLSFPPPPTQLVPVVLWAVSPFLRIRQLHKPLVGQSL